MKIDNVTHAQQKDDRSIELTITDPFEGSSVKKRYAAIRGGISWPTSKAPAYLCVIGQEYIAPPSMPGKKVSVGKRFLLTEYEAKFLSLSDFYGKITDAAEQLLCRSFYAEMPEDRFESGYLNDLNAYSRDRKSKVSLSEAYDVDNFLLGVSRIKGSMDKGELALPKDSIIYSQLQSISQEDLDNSPEETFYAINAVRHVISSYYRFTPTIPIVSRRRPPINWRVM